MGFLYTNGLQRRMGPFTLAMQQPQPAPQGALQGGPPPVQDPQGALPAPPPPVAAPPPPPANAAQQLVATAPMRQGYSPAVAAALMRNAPNQHLTMPAMPQAPMQPAPYQHPAPLVIPPPAAGALTPTPDPTQTPGMIAARAAGSPSGGLPNSVAFGGLGLLGLGKQNSSAIQDIGRALGMNRTITDAQWKQAGFGPGGA